MSSKYDVRMREAKIEFPFGVVAVPIKLPRGVIREELRLPPITWSSITFGKRKDPTRLRDIDRSVDGILSAVAVEADDVSLDELTLDIFQSVI